MKILIADAFDAKMPERLKTFGEVSDNMADLADAEVLLIRSKTKVTAEMVAQAPRLKLVIRGGVGLDNVDKKACEARGPPPADCPLLTAPNVFMAPHLGGSSKENLGRICDEVVAIMGAFKG